jgi:hypothetical protein
MEDRQIFDVLIGLVTGTFAVVFITLIFVFLFLWLVYFLLTAFSLYHIAQRRGITHPFLAWIPFAQTYLFAEIIGKELTVGTKTIPQFPWIFIGINYGSFIIRRAIGLIPFVGLLLNLLLAPAIYAVDIYVQYRFYKSFATGNEVIFTILSAIIPISHPIILLYLRNKPFAEEAPVVMT